MEEVLFLVFSVSTFLACGSPAKDKEGKVPEYFTAGLILALLLLPFLHCLRLVLDSGRPRRFVQTDNVFFSSFHIRQETLRESFGR